MMHAEVWKGFRSCEFVICINYDEEVDWINFVETEVVQIAGFQLLHLAQITCGSFGQSSKALLQHQQEEYHLLICRSA